MQGAYTAAAAPALTKIQDTLYKADGTRFEGVAQIEWKSFQAADGSQVPQQSVSVKIVSGQLRVSLVPTTNAKKPMKYTVKFNADGKTQFVEYWDVPPSTSALAVENVRSAPLGESITIGGGTIGEIQGLRTELDVRPTKGAAFLASRAAIINASGALEGAIGLPGDCIRVDGTSGPCGGGPGSITFMDAETPAGSINGLNGVFSLAGTPVSPNSLHLFRNGILLKRGFDYTLVGALITFDPSFPHRATCYKPGIECLPRPPIPISTPTTRYRPDSWTARTRHSTWEHHPRPPRACNFTGTVCFRNRGSTSISAATW